MKMMSLHRSNDSRPLSFRRTLRAGDWVQVRNLSEIIATLDSEGKLDSLPFMPEMIQFCGKQFMVAKRVEKTCIAHTQVKMSNAVHLTGLRCDGSAHDECQSGCLLFWREDWLKLVSTLSNHAAPRIRNGDSGVENKLHTRAAARDGDTTYVCQATELEKASKGPLKIWNLGQYYREIRSRNVGWCEVKHLCHWLSAWFQWRVFRFTSNTQTTPIVEKQAILAGDLVKIRPKEEIMGSLTKYGKHLGLAFRAEMLTFCGKRYRVLKRVEHMIDEETGKMKILKNNCLVLDSVVCRGNCTLCPRANFHFWRDEWLEKIL